jgi:hypothetical protein
MQGIVKVFCLECAIRSKSKGHILFYVSKEMAHAKKNVGHLKTRITAIAKLRLDLMRACQRVACRHIDRGECLMGQQVSDVCRRCSGRVKNAFF